MWGHQSLYTYNRQPRFVHWEGILLNHDFIPIGALSQHFSNMRAPGITYQSTDSVQTGGQFHPKSFSLFIKLCFCPVIHEAPSPETQQCPFHTSKAQNNFLCHRWAWYRRIDEMQSQTNVIKQFMGILNPDLLPHTRSCFVKCVPCVAPDSYQKSLITASDGNPHRHTH